MANRVYKLIHKMLNFGVSRDWVDANVATAEEADQDDAPVDRGQQRRPSAARTITPGQQKRFFAIANTAGWKDRGALRDALFQKFGVRESDKIASAQYDEVCEYFKQPPTPVDPDMPF
jgi:hypothetical protein